MSSPAAPSVILRWHAQCTSKYVYNNAHDVREHKVKEQVYFHLTDPIRLYQTFNGVSR